MPPEGVSIKVLVTGMVQVPVFTSLKGLDEWLEGDGKHADIQEISYSAPTTLPYRFRAEVRHPGFACMGVINDMLTIVATVHARATLASALGLYGHMMRVSTDGATMDVQGVGAITVDLANPERPHREFDSIVELRNWRDGDGKHDIVQAVRFAAPSDARRELSRRFEDLSTQGTLVDNGEQMAVWCEGPRSVELLESALRWYFVDRFISPDGAGSTPVA